ncbi:MAG: FAD:protein FMN transferase [Oceanipulchritudo sp.]
MKRRQFILSLAGTAAAGLAGWKLTGSANDVRLAKVTRTGWALGANVRLTVFHNDQAVAEQALEAAFAEIDRIEDIMSLYREDSAICRLNRDGFLDHPDSALVEVLTHARALSARTGGAFDVTVQPLWTLYNRHAQMGTLPGDEEIRAVLSRIGWKRLEVKPERIALQGKGTEITLNGIAQGYAADAVARVFKDHGIHSALIDTGEIEAIGTHAEKDQWSIGIKHPRKEREMLGLAGLRDRCLATSGDYESRFSAGYRDHHLLDPRTGHSPSELSSVSVAARTALQADALSTAVFLLGLVKGRELVEITPGADALFVTKDGRMIQTDGFPAIA